MNSENLQAEVSNHIPHITRSTCLAPSSANISMRQFGRRNLHEHCIPPHYLRIPIPWSHQNLFSKFMAAFFLLLGFSQQIAAQASAYGKLSSHSWVGHVVDSHIEQCGGIGYTGQTTCDAGYTCIISSSTYSHCLPAPIPPGDQSPWGAWIITSLNEKFWLLSRTVWRSRLQWTHSVFPRVLLFPTITLLFTVYPDPSTSVQQFHNLYSDFSECNIEEVIFKHQVF